MPPLGSKTRIFKSCPKHRQFQETCAPCRKLNPDSGECEHGDLLRHCDICTKTPTAGSPPQSEILERTSSEEVSPIVDLPFPFNIAAWGDVSEKEIQRVALFHWKHNPNTYWKKNILTTSSFHKAWSEMEKQCKDWTPPPPKTVEIADPNCSICRGTGADVRIPEDDDSEFGRYPADIRPVVRFRCICVMDLPKGTSYPPPVKPIKVWKTKEGTCNIHGTDRYWGARSKCPVCRELK